MLTNIFKQLASEALKVSRNQTVSYTVQNLIKEANATQLVMLMNAFAKDWEISFSDRYVKVAFV